LGQSVPPALKAKPEIQAFKAQRWLVRPDRLVVPDLQAGQARSVIRALKAAPRLVWLVHPALPASRVCKAKRVRRVPKVPLV
jgi:hypothetical protein